MLCVSSLCEVYVLPFVGGFLSYRRTLIQSRCRRWFLVWQNCLKIISGGTSCQRRSLRSKTVLFVCNSPVSVMTRLSLITAWSLSRSLEESVCKPFCLIFRNLVTMQEDNSGFSVLLDMLAELYQKQPKIGYHLLYYLKAR